MALKYTIAIGMSPPHRSVDPIPAAEVRNVARRADALGFQDPWVTNNTVDEAGCFDSLTLRSYAAAVTTTIRLGRADEYEVFAISTARRVTRFTESVEMIKALWAAALSDGWIRAGGSSMASLAASVGLSAR